MKLRKCETDQQQRNNWQLTELIREHRRGLTLSLSSDRPRKEQKLFTKRNQIQDSVRCLPLPFFYPIQLVTNTLRRDWAMSGNPRKARHEWRRAWTGWRWSSPWSGWCQRARPGSKHASMDSTNFPTNNLFSQWVSRLPDCCFFSVGVKNSDSRRLHWYMNAEASFLRTVFSPPLLLCRSLARPCSPISYPDSPVAVVQRWNPRTLSNSLLSDCWCRPPKSGVHQPVLSLLSCYFHLFSPVAGCP